MRGSIVLVCASACWAFRLPPLPPPRTASRLVRPRATLDHHDVATDGLASTVERALQQQNFAAVACLDSEPVLDVAARVFSGGGAGQRAAAALVYRNASSSADNSLELVGIFTERDYCRDVGGDDDAERRLISRATDSVAEWMTPRRDLVWVRSSATVSEAMARMASGGFRHLVVTDDDASGASDADGPPPGSVRGLLSLGDIVGLAEADDARAARELYDAAELVTRTATSEGRATTAADRLVRAVNRPGDARDFNAAEAARRASLNAITVARDATDSGPVVRTTVALAGLVAVLAATTQLDGWIAEHALGVMSAVFAVGYAGIVLEDLVEIDKAAVSLMMAVALWTVLSTAQIPSSAGTLAELSGHLAETADICFFLISAQAVVGLVDAHDGFRVLTETLGKLGDVRKLFWTTGVVTFFVSALLNNLTVTIVMVSLCKKLPRLSLDERRLFGAMIVIAANAGGAWSPVGDITTTMLWINGQLSASHTVTDLFVPSAVSMVVSLALLQGLLPSEEDAEPVDEVLSLNPPSATTARANEPLAPSGALVSCVGAATLLGTPIFKEITGLPPYLGMLGGLGVLWALTDVLHGGESGNRELRMGHALRQVNLGGVLFFSGVLLSIGALESSGLLSGAARSLDDLLRPLGPASDEFLAGVLGLVSSFIENVPLVAATMGMYDTASFPIDSELWQLIAYSVGTGGSILVIGSSSGVALMGLEKVEFLWYLKNVSASVVLGYLAGLATYVFGAAVLAS